jgi:hypothetical protein
VLLVAFLPSWSSQEVTVIAAVLGIIMLVEVQVAVPSAERPSDRGQIA